MGKRIVLVALGFLFVLASTYAQATRYFLYVTNTNTSYRDAGSANLYAYTINPSTGAFTEVSGSPFVAGTYPVGIAVEPAGKFVYVANNVAGVIGGMYVFALTINSRTGALTGVNGSPYAGSSPFSVAVDPTGKFLYVANKGSSDIASSVSAYTINPSTGALTEVSGSPFVAGTYPVGIAVDRTGNFVYVANNGSANVSAFTINPGTGALSAISGSPFAAGTSPAGIATDPTGKFLYVANNGSANVSAYTINPSTGALRAVSGSPFAGSSPFEVAVDPTGKFLYATNNFDDNVSAYKINTRNGALTPVVGSPFVTGSIPKGIALDPTGKFVYVANNGSANVSAFTINPSTGALSALDGSPFYVAPNLYGAAIAAVTGP